MHTHKSFRVHLQGSTEKCFMKGNFTFPLHQFPGGAEFFFIQRLILTDFSQIGSSKSRAYSIRTFKMMASSWGIIHYSFVITYKGKSTPLTMETISLMIITQLVFVIPTLCTLDCANILHIYNLFWCSNKFIRWKLWLFPFYRLGNWFKEV